MKLPMMLHVEKAPLPPLPPFEKSEKAMPPLPGVPACSALRRYYLSKKD